MKCGNCNYHKVVQTTTTVEEWRDGHLIVIKDVPVERCPQCGEEYFSPNVLRAIERIICTMPKPAAILKVPVFEYASSTAI